MPYVQEPMPVVCTPPMRQWPMLQLPYGGGITEIKHLNMRGLQELYCDDNPLTTLPWDELQDLYYLSVYYCAFVTLELWRLPNLYSCYAGDNYDLETVDAHDMPNLGDIDLYYCQSLVDLDITG